MSPENNLGNVDINTYTYDKNIYDKKPNTISPPEKNIGVDTNEIFIDNIIEAGLSSQLDLSKIQSFSQVANNRETVLQLLDTMAEDPTIAAALEVYAEDTTESNDSGDIVWCNSDSPEVSKYITYLLDTMNVNKNIYKWAYSLCKYGDVYLRLYRESEYNDNLFNNPDSKEKDTLNEDLILKAYSKADRYSHYVEMVPNPAEMFELTRFGKTYGYIRADVNSYSKKDTNLYTPTYRYSFNRDDVEVFGATNFVHAALEDNNSRVPEEVKIFLNDDDYKTNTNGLTYTVRRGQSLLYNMFKIWRMMMLLENSMLLNRLTKSSIIRIIGVEVGDMPKENVGPHLMKIKQLLEQKSALNVDTSLSEYTNPGPIENNVYIPTHGGQGAISIQTVNDDINVNGIADIDYFKTKLYSSLRIPKQYLGDTDDPGGFNGGTSLSLVSSRYAKAIKRIQNTLCQMITDAVNLMLIDKGLDNYVNKFTIKMQAPTTQEEKDRKDTQGTNINMIQDIMTLLDGTEIEDASVKLKILKSLLSETLTDPEIISIIQDEIDKLEKMEDQGVDTTEDDESNDFNDRDDMDEFGHGIHRSSPNMNDFEEPENDMQNMDQQMPDESETSLPTPEELGVGDLTDLNNPEI